MRSIGEISTKEIITLYGNAAAAHGRAILDGDHAVANKQYEIVARYSEELKKRGPEAQELLLRLLNDVNPDIRFCAAVDILDFAPERGEQELTKLAKSKAIVGLNAYAILKERGKSDLKFASQKS